MKQAPNSRPLKSILSFSTLNSGLRDETSTENVTNEKSQTFSTLNSGLRDETLLLSL